MVTYIQNIVPGSFGLFDSELNNGRYAANNNFDLVVILKVFLRPKNEGRKIIRDSDQNRFRINDWQPGDWNSFKTTYQQTGQNFWDHKFWLRTPNEYRELDCDMGEFRVEQIMATRMERVQSCYAYGLLCHDELRTYQEPMTVRRGLLSRRHINCRFRLEMVDSPSTAHKTIDAYYITHRYSNGRWIPIRPGHLTHFRSDDSTYSSSDLIQEEMLFERHRISFQTHIHEIGHAIGLEHSAVSRQETRCINIIKREGLRGRDGSNSRLCYGSTLESASDVMGMGMNLTWHDALPWRVAVERHTSISRHRWEIHQRPINPTVVN